MLPRSFLTQLIPSRIAEARRRLEKLIWETAPDVTITVEQTTSLTTHCGPERAATLKFEPVPACGFHWGPKFAQRWFRVTLPPAPDARTRYLTWEDQAEATAYLDEVPYCGLDVAHRHCPLPANVTHVLIESVCVKTGMWVKGAQPLDEAGSLYAPPRLAWRNDLAWETYHDLSVLLEILEIECDDYQPGAKKPVTDLVRHSPAIFRASPLFRRWCARLDTAVDAFDHEGLPGISRSLKKIYVDFPAETGALDARLTGHAHIDLVWLWPEHVGEFKAVHSWATQTRLMEQYPEFKFGYSQPASYNAVARKAPQLHERVRQLITEGRWDATGGAYVEFDTQLPCGEGLLRGLRIGQEEFRALRGTPSKVCWLPDVFGYTGALPQLLRGFGIDYFFTTKLSWNTVNRMPHTSFRWKGNDGSSVLAHVVLLHDYNETVDLRNLREDALHHQQSAVHPEFLVPTGYGDGGGGPTAEMCERARRITNLAGAPRASWENIEPFFERMAQIASELPDVRGELLFELHRGVFTTHGALKAAFRGLERAVQMLEAAHVARHRGPIDQHFWRRLLFAQFHDYIPGSSVWEVYAEGIPELLRLSQEAHRLAHDALTSDPAPGWFNPLPIRRTWVDGADCFVLSPLSGAPRTQLSRQHVSPPQASVTSLESERVRATFTQTGNLAALEIDGHSCALAEAGHSLAVYPDHPAKFEAWDIDRGTLCHGIAAQAVGDTVVKVDGLTASVSFAYRFGEKSSVQVTFSVTAGEPALRVDYDIDWHEPLTLLKAIFSTGYTGREARFGAPFGSTLRGQLPGYAREEAQWEVPASRWMIVSDDAQAEGLAIITESKYGFSVREGVAGVSLLRSAYVTGADEHPQIRTVPDRPRHSDLGRQQVRIALSRFTSQTSLEEQPAALADTLFTPCLRYGGKATHSGFAGLTAADSLAPSWAEPVSPTTWILRLHETLGRRGNAQLAVSSGWRARVIAMGMDAAQINDQAALWHAEMLPVVFAPYQVVSIAFLRDTTRDESRSAG